jgi:hypothetical protein
VLSTLLRRRRSSWIHFSSTGRVMMRLPGGDHSVSERQAHLSIDRICRAPGQNGSIKADLVAHRRRQGDAKVQ